MWDVIRSPVGAIRWGSTMDNTLGRLGRAAHERWGDRAHQAGQGPHAVADNIISLFGEGRDRVRNLAAVQRELKIPKAKRHTTEEQDEKEVETTKRIDPSALQKQCSRFVKYTLRSFAEMCLSKAPISLTIEEYHITQVVQYELGTSKCVVGELLLAHGSCDAATDITNSLSIRYLGQIVALVEFWDQVKVPDPGRVDSPPMAPHTTVQKLVQSHRPSIMKVFDFLASNFLDGVIKPFKLRFWEMKPEALEALGPDLWKHSINGTSSGLLAP
ncbi:hypothetical protein B0H14DRAFT_2556170 [Mycena olivaceomarginata]|nr:hypothetical protein B0H14DRAFT_2556170 [Mycena olivaceomarginata]